MKMDKVTLSEYKSIVYDLKLHQLELELQNEELRKAQSELENLKARYFDIYDLAPEGYLILSESGRIIESNLTAAKMLGESRQSLLNKQLTSYINKEYQDVYYTYKKRLFNSHAPQECELMMTTHDNTNLWGHMKSSLVNDEGNFSYRMVISDITNRKSIEDQLNQSLNDLMISQRIAHLGTWRVNLLTDQVFWSEELSKIYGVDPELSPLCFSEHNKLFDDNSWKALSAAIEHTKVTGEPFELELESIGTNEAIKWIWIRGESQRDATGAIVGMWGTAQDITERKINADNLIYLSTHDHLTGLYNRRFFEQQLTTLDIPENLPVSIIMFDVNGLKLVNDSFGHDLGDVLLKKAAETIQSICRADDLIARVGGDEFVLVLPKTSAIETEKIASHIKSLTSKEIVANIELSISYGYDTKLEENQSISEIVINAENHMYKHKLYERTSIRSRTIELILNTLFEKSKQEARHSNKVSTICQAIAVKMDLDQNRVNQLRVVGLMHDIGKIGIDEKILNKKGALSNVERIEIERHPEIGWRLLNSSNEFSELAQFVIHHHEKWDGTGYPNGLKGEAIQLEARIIAVAEAYDAMTRFGNFKTKLTHDEAIEELTRCSGADFDPKVIEIFLEIASIIV